ncbi:MAG: hypothetical protein NT166_30895, partial [Candidatus Aminicenantes bacterium]|nr:hypothetical protein [Candidatus Aminicenantes bacterium]
MEKADHDALRDRLMAVENQLIPVKDEGDAPFSPASAPAVKEKKEKRLSKMAIWASILGFVLAVIALVVTLILSSSSDKQ